MNEADGTQGLVSVSCVCTGWHSAAAFTVYLITTITTVKTLRTEDSGGASESSQDGGMSALEGGGGW